MQTSPGAQTLMWSCCAHVTAEPVARSRVSFREPKDAQNRAGLTELLRGKQTQAFTEEFSHISTMDGYGLSEDEVFSPCLLNFTWENSNEQVRASRLLLSASSHLIYSLKRCCCEISCRGCEFCVVNKQTLTNIVSKCDVVAWSGTLFLFNSLYVILYLYLL